jgi:ParB family chromosome partitioning protein
MSVSIKSPAKAHITRGLGKGLSALMSDSYSQTAEVTAAQQGDAAPRDGAVVTLALDEVEPGKYQPRDYFDQGALQELAESIRRNGVVQPILVRRAADGKYEIIAGERRWRAAGIAGLRQIPAIVRTYEDKKVLEIALVENVQREDLNPLEEAAGYQRLIEEFTYTQEELAATVHKSRSHIANLIRLLDLPEDIRHLLAENKLSMGHARALFGAPDALQLAHDIIARGLSVRQTEKLVRQNKGVPAEQRPRKSRAETQAPAAAASQAPLPASLQPVLEPSRTYMQRDPDIMALEETLSENLGLKVAINDRGQSGDITISYASLEQLDDILRRLGGSI